MIGICLISVLGTGLLCSNPTVGASDSFCSTYQRVIVAPGEAAEVARASGGVKRRIGANDVTYRCLCEKWDNPICKR